MSLFTGALVFMFVTLVQTVWAMGIFMLVAAIFCITLVNILAFGIMAKIVSNFGRGNFGSNFMPDFAGFSVWDDVIHPFFLSIGVYISSFGPFIIVAAIGFWLVMISVGSHMDAVQSDLVKLPGTHYYYDPQKTIKQSDDVKKVLDDTNKSRLERRLQTSADASNVIIDSRSSGREELLVSVQRTNTAQPEPALEKTIEMQFNDAMFQGFLSLPAPIVVVGAIFFLWGAFYFPAACAVAANTRSFRAAVNPATGLKTIRKFGFIYPKVLIMAAVIVVAFVLIDSVLDWIFAPFTLPGVGNFAVKTINSFFIFYFSVVFSCVIGYALLKGSEHPKLPA